MKLSRNLLTFYDMIIQHFFYQMIRACKNYMSNSEISLYVVFLFMNMLMLFIFINSFVFSFIEPDLTSFAILIGTIIDQLFPVCYVITYVFFMGLLYFCGYYNRDYMLISNLRCEYRKYFIEQGIKYSEFSKKMVSDPFFKFYDSQTKCALKYQHENHYVFHKKYFRPNVELKEYYELIRKSKEVSPELENCFQERKDSFLRFLSSDDTINCLKKSNDYFILFLVIANNNDEIMKLGPKSFNNMYKRFLMKEKNGVAIKMFEDDTVRKIAANVLWRKDFYYIKSNDNKKDKTFIRDEDNALYFHFIGELNAFLTKS